MKLNQRSPLALTKWPAACGDPASPASLDGIVHPDHHWPIRYEAIDDQTQQTPRHCAQIPSGTIEDLVIAGKVRRFGASRHSQAGADSALARCQYTTLCRRQKTLAVQIPY